MCLVARRSQLCPKNHTNVRKQLHLHVDLIVSELLTHPPNVSWPTVLEYAIFEALDRNLLKPDFRCNSLLALDG